MYENFAEKLVIYDPLNREMKACAGQNMTPKQAELLQIINGLKPLNSKNLNAPISIKLQDELERLFKTMLEKCNTEIQSHIKLAEKH